MILFNRNIDLILKFLGKGEAVDAMLESLKVINEPLRSFATVLVECCAYAGTGNVLKIQHMLHICSEHFDNKDEKKVKLLILKLKRFRRISSRKVKKKHQKIKIKIKRKMMKQLHKMLLIKV
jgi:hypothetical protein